MGKIVVSTFVTLDGVMEDPQDWSFDYQSEDTLAGALEVLFATDALLLGRTTYESFAEAWPGREDPMGFADKMNSVAKYVVSTTLTDPSWANTTVIATDVAEQVRALKRQVEGTILIYGSATLMRSLMEHDLVDEFVFLLNPVVVGKGRRLFPEGELAKGLMPTGAQTYSGGMTALRFTPAGVPAAA